MADLKISQLPAATVPLAGTEVLPIVQSGTTKQVTIDNAIASRASLGANTFTAAQEWATGTAIASSATINLNTATGNRVHITGTTAITAVTLTRGPRTLIFDGVLTLTHNSTTNNLPGGVNITTAAGDRAIYESDGTTVYCVSYIKASGLAVVVSGGFTLGTSAATTSGTSIDFTGIPAGVKQIVISYRGVSTSGTSQFTVQIGDSGGFETTGYSCQAMKFADTPAITSTGNVTLGWVFNQGAASTANSGSLVLTLENATTFVWCGNGILQDNNATMTIAAGSKALSAELDRVRITTYNGTDTFDAGEVNIAYI